MTSFVRTCASSSSGKRSSMKMWVLKGAVFVVGVGHNSITDHYGTTDRIRAALG